MNVIYLSTTGIGGATLSLLNMVNSVKKYVNPIVVFPDKNGIYSTYMEHGIECIVVPFQEEIFYKGSFLKYPLLQKVRFILGRIRNIMLWNTTFEKKVKAHLNGRHIDIVHTNNGAIGLGFSLARTLNTKHVWHLREFQDIDFDARPFFGWNRFYKNLYASDAVICITTAIANHFKISTNCKHGSVIWNAVASRDEAIYIKDKDNYICFVASVISFGKGLHDLLRAYALSKLKDHDIKLKIVGDINDTDYKKEIFSIVNELKLDNHIVWMGFCKNTKDIISRAKALIMPSLSEALGRVAIEGMFYGCPIIARNSGGPKEYMKDEDIGYLFNNVNELSQKLETVCFTDQTTMIERCQKFAINNFSEEVYSDKIFNLYNEIL